MALTEGQDVVPFESAYLIVALFAGVIPVVDTVVSGDDSWMLDVPNLPKLASQVCHEASRGFKSEI